MYLCPTPCTFHVNMLGLCIFTGYYAYSPKNHIYRNTYTTNYKTKTYTRIHNRNFNIYILQSFSPFSASISSYCFNLWLFGVFGLKLRCCCFFCFVSCVQAFMTRVFSLPSDAHPFKLPEKTLFAHHLKIQRIFKVSILRQRETQRKRK